MRELLRFLMVKLQSGIDNFFATIPKALVESKGWKRGDELAFMLVGGEIVPQSGDIIIRKVR